MNAEVFLYYEEDVHRAEDDPSYRGSNVIVYRQFLIRADKNSPWVTNGAYEGYAPIEALAYMQGGNIVYSIDPDKWQPGAIPILIE